MTRATPPSSTPKPFRRWPLHEAKRSFGELVRRVRSEGPQHVTVSSHDEVVVITNEDFQRLTGARDGRALIAVLQASPYGELDLDAERAIMPVRDVVL